MWLVRMWDVIATLHAVFHNTFLFSFRSSSSSFRFNLSTRCGQCGMLSMFRIYLTSATKFSYFHLMEMNGIFDRCETVERFANSQRRKQIKHSIRFALMHQMRRMDMFWLIKLTEWTFVVPNEKRNSELQFFVVACLLLYQQNRSSALHQHHLYIINGFWATNICYTLCKQE